MIVIMVHQLYIRKDHFTLLHLNVGRRVMFVLILQILHSSRIGASQTVRATVFQMDAAQAAQAVLTFAKEFYNCQMCM